MRRLEPKDRFCETNVSWKHNLWPSVHRADVTLSLYSPGLGYKTPGCFRASLPKSLDGSMLHVTVGPMF